MDKQNLQTLKGFRDFLPKEAKKRQFAIDKIKKTFELFGFEPLETPALEYEELLLGKYGAEGDKLMYRFTDNGDRKVALRYDQTVPTARILAMYNQTLPMPWKRFQVQPVWRAENTQAGRFREFLQCDADIYGSDSPLADAEIIALSHKLYVNLGFTEFDIFVNDRNILFGLMKMSGIDEKLYLSSIAAIDKLDRKTSEEVSADLEKSGVSKDSIEHLFHHLEEEKPSEYLEQVIESTLKLGVNSKNIKFQARLARGLDYYTSTIFEIKIKGYESGSVLGGGRYDSLIGKLSGVEIPAVGFAVGFDRTLEAMEQFNLFPEVTKRSGILVTIFGKDLLEPSLTLTKDLRENGVSAEIYPNALAKLDKQLKFADKKGIKWLIVIGPDEFKADKVILKNLENGDQDEVKLNDLIKKVTS